MRGWVGFQLTAGILAFGIVALAILWGAVAREIHYDQHSARENLATEMATLARAVEEHSLRTFRQVDQALLHLRDTYVRHPDDLAEEIAIFQRGSQDMLVQIGVIGPDGFLAYTNQQRVTTQVDLSDREHFVFHRDGKDDRLFISKPILGRVTQKWSLQFTRPIPLPDGGFGGVMVMSVDPEFFSRFFTALDLPEGSAITLVGLDRVVRARASRPEPAEDPKGQEIPPDRPFFQPDAPTAGAYEQISQFDGKLRIAAFRRMADQPMVVAVSRDQRAAFAAVEARRQFLMAFGSVVSVVIVLFSGSLVWLVRRQVRDHGELELSRQALARQASELKRSNGELETFAYAASHDLREPLRMVSSYLGLVERRLEGKLDDELREFLHYAKDGAQRMDHLILDLLEYSRVGRSEQPAETVPLKEILDTVGLVLAPALAEAGGAIAVSGPMPDLHGVRQELVRLFQNLVANAIKYRDLARPLKVTVEVTEAPGEVIIAVKDNGIGIEPQHFQRIFAIFQRLHPHGEHEGTGIGLALCKKIAEHHGGRIWLDSIPGAGSTFHVALPSG